MLFLVPVWIKHRKLSYPVTVAAASSCFFSTLSLPTLRWGFLQPKQKYKKLMGFFQSGFSLDYFRKDLLVFRSQTSQWWQLLPWICTQTFRSNMFLLLHFQMTFWQQCCIVSLTHCLYVSARRFGYSQVQSGRVHTSDIIAVHRDTIFSPAYI